MKKEEVWISHEDGKPLNIVAQFTRFEDKEHVRSNARKL